MQHTLISLFLLNAIAHFISYKRLKKINDPGSAGVMAFIFINAIIAILIGLNLDWAKWLALLFPIIGGLGLLLTTLVKNKGTLVDYVIFILDVLIIGWILIYFPI